MRIAVFTSGRQDWSILLPVVRAMQASTSITVVLIAGGMHARDGQRLTELDGCLIDSFLAVLPENDDDAAVARAAGATTSALTDALVAQRAEALVLLGDRTETLAAGLAATCLRLPLIHIHGGEETAGSIDNACRHALTQLAALHCVAHQKFAERIIAMGATPENVVVCGAPAIDLILTTPMLDASTLARDIGVPKLGSPLLVCTYHPTTLSAQHARDEISIIIQGIEKGLHAYPQAQVVVTRANCDAGGTAINDAFAAWAAGDKRICLVSDLGVQRYWSLLAHAHVMIGNSSSGILEAPSFDLPVINIGNRQAGRLRIHTVHDVPVNADTFARTLADVLSHPRTMVTPHASAYGNGNAAKSICTAIERFVIHRSTRPQLSQQVNV